MKKSELRTMVREIVREEVALTMKEVIKEMIGGGTPEPKPKRKPKPKYYSKNSVLNDILNETANDDSDWATMGGGTYDSNRMNEVISSNYGEMMNGESQPNGNLAAKMGVNPEAEGMDFLTKDYRPLMKAVGKKKDGE